MNKLLGFAAVAASVLSMAVTDASAWERKSSYADSQGNHRSVEAHGKCDDGGNCTYKRVVKTPSGETRTVTGNLRTDPYGGKVIYGGSARCSGDSCSYSGGAAGPNGYVRGSGTISRY